LTRQDKTDLAGLGETNNRFSLALAKTKQYFFFQNNQFAASVIKITLQIRVRVVVGKYNCLKYHRTLIVGLKLLITKGREQVPVDRQKFSTFVKTERKNSFCKITIYLYL
jgi:hypothetical protein